MEQPAQKVNADGIKFSNNLLSIASVILAITWLRFTHWVGYMAIPPLCMCFYLFRPSHHVQLGFWWVVLSFTRTGPRYEGICYCMEPCFAWSHFYGVALTGWFCFVAYYDLKSRNMSHYSVLAFILAFICPSETELVTCEENHIVVWIRLCCWLAFAMLPLHYVYQSLSIFNAKKTDVRVPKKIFNASLSAGLFLCLPLLIWPLAILPLLIEYHLLSDLWIFWCLLCVIHLFFYFSFHWLFLAGSGGLLLVLFFFGYIRKRYEIFQFTVKPEVLQEPVTPPVAV